MFKDQLSSAAVDRTQVTMRKIDAALPTREWREMSPERLQLERKLVEIEISTGGKYK